MAHFLLLKQESPAFAERVNLMDSPYVSGSQTSSKGTSPGRRTLSVQQLQTQTFGFQNAVNRGGATKLL